LLEKVMTR